MEIGSRNGGSYIPRTIYHSTGFNIVKTLFDFLMNKEVHIPEIDQKSAICFTLHSNSIGIFESFEIEKDLKPFVAEKHLYKQLGDKIEPYKNPGIIFGCVGISFREHGRGK